MMNNLTIGELMKTLEFAIQNNYITPEHLILVGGNNNDTCIINGLILPSVILDSNKEFKTIQIMFTAPSK